MVWVRVNWESVPDLWRCRCAKPCQEHHGHEDHSARSQAVRNRDKADEVHKGIHSDCLRLGLPLDSRIMLYIYIFIWIIHIYIYLSCTWCDMFLESEHLPKTGLSTPCQMGGNGLFNMSIDYVGGATPAVSEVWSTAKEATTLDFSLDFSSTSRVGTVGTLYRTCGANVCCLCNILVKVSLCDRRCMTAGTW